jgi:uncharacterized membrane protein YGL010W
MFNFFNLLLAHSLITAMMTGIIWFVQLVHYPLFPLASGQNYPLYHRRHEQGITRVVVPLMLAELVTAVVLLFRFPAGVSRSLFYLSLALLAILWLSTFALQLPLHRRLESGFEFAAWQALARTNWLRTLIWSFRLAVLFLILARQATLP